MKSLDRRTINGALLAGAGLLSMSGTAYAVFDRDAVIAEATKLLREKYIDSYVGDRIAAMLEANNKSGAYDKLVSPTAFAERLTKDIRDMTHDLHMRVDYAPATVDADNAATLAEDELHPRTTGYGIQTVARLQGNIGLLRITHFPSPPITFAERYAGMMEIVASTDALILDFTVNHGGGTDTASVLLSYFLDKGIVLNRYIERGVEPEMLHTWTDTPGPKYGTERPVYILISRDTFSAGEAIAYHMKDRKRATLIGERTKGGAHAGNTFKLPSGFEMFVVYGRVDGPDWEGTGVLPDIAAAPSECLRKAHTLALKTLLAAATEPKRAQILRNVINRSIENLSSFDL